MCAYSFPNITLLALIRTLTSSPTLIPSSLTASTVTVDVTVLPPPMSTFTFAATMPSCTLVTFPLKMFLVLSFISSSPSWNYLFVGKRHCVRCDPNMGQTTIRVVRSLIYSTVAFQGNAVNHDTLPKIHYPILNVVGAGLGK